MSGSASSWRLARSSTRSSRRSARRRFSSSRSTASVRSSARRSAAFTSWATAEKARLIQDLKRTNAALTATNTQLEQQYADALEARRVKDQFLQNISHELRT